MTPRCRICLHPVAADGDICRACSGVPPQNPFLCRGCGLAAKITLPNPKYPNEATLHTRMHILDGYWLCDECFDE